MVRNSFQFGGPVLGYATQGSFLGVAPQVQKASRGGRLWGFEFRDSGFRMGKECLLLFVVMFSGWCLVMSK